MAAKQPNDPVAGAHLDCTAPAGSEETPMGPTSSPLQGDCVDAQGQAALDRMIANDVAEVAKAWGIENRPRSGKSLLQRMTEGGVKPSKNVEDRTAEPDPTKIPTFPRWETVQGERWETEMHRFARWLAPIYEFVRRSSVEPDVLREHLRLAAEAVAAYDGLSMLARIQLHARHPNLAMFISGSR
jgi:hypothetical protein